MINENQIRSMLSNYVVKVRASLRFNGCFYVTLSNIKSQSWDGCNFHFNKDINTLFDNCKEMSKNHYFVNTNDVETWGGANVE